MEGIARSGRNPEARNESKSSIGAYFSLKEDLKRRLELIVNNKVRHCLPTILDAKRMQCRSLKYKLKQVNVSVNDAMEALHRDENRSHEDEKM